MIRAATRAPEQSRLERFPTAPALLRFQQYPSEGNPMNLAEALAQSRPQIGQTCYTGKLLAASDAKTRAEIQAALDNPDLSNAHLARAFALLGHKINDGAVRRHRVGECRCGS